MKISKGLLEYLDQDIKKHLGQMLQGSPDLWRLKEVTMREYLSSQDIQVITMPLIPGKGVIRWIFQKK